MKEKNERNRGAILPIVLLAMVISQMLFFAVMQIYRSQMQLNLLLSQHYQAQTLILLTEDYLLNDASQNVEELEYNIGSIKIEEVEQDTLRIKCTLHSGYSEEKLIKIEKEEPEEADANAASLF